MPGPPRRPAVTATLMSCSTYHPDSPSLNPPLTTRFSPSAGVAVGVGVAVGAGRDVNRGDGVGLGGATVAACSPDTAVGAAKVAALPGTVAAIVCVARATSSAITS